MQFSVLFFSFILSGAVIAKDHNGTSTKAVSEKDQCHEITSLNRLVALASNTTKLDKVTKNNATKIAEIQAKASSASTTLSTLQSNSTLMSACAVIDAAQAETDGCQQTFMLERFIAFAANTTAVASATKNNATKIADIELKASDAAVKLQSLQSNSTLQAACPAVMQKDECTAMDKLEKFVSVANNSTKLNEITKGNATKAAEIQAMAAKAQTKLTAMQGNATFVQACDALKASDSEKGTTSSSAAAASSSAAKTSGASLGSEVGVGALGTLLVVALGMLTL